MGRPIRKDRMLSNFPGATAAGTNRIAVSNYRTGGANTASTAAYIVSQRGSKQFKIHLDDSSEEIMTLVTDATLSVNGTFNVRVILDDSTVAHVEKFYNNTVHYTKADGTHGHVPYSLGTEQDDQGQVSGHGNIDVV